MLDIVPAVEAVLGTSVVHVVPLGGGDVADAYRVALVDSVVFAKTKPAAPPGFFTTEAAGLRWLRASDTVPVPEVRAVSEDPPLLVLDWVEPGRARPDTDATFGRALAALHASGAPSFGREDRRSTGSRGLPNEPCATWAEFYATQRLEPLARLASEAGALPLGVIDRLRNVAARISNLAGPEEPPARLHGDLWAGNRLVDIAGASWLIDPAAIGGHREFDLAMMRLFGGFGASTFAAYNEVSPPAPGWERRVALHQLAPLVVHAIKFGSSYVAPTIRALDALG